MIVVMTMWLPRLACSTPGTAAQAAPKTPAASTAAGIRSQGGRKPPCRQTSAAPSPPT